MNKTSHNISIKLLLILLLMGFFGTIRAEIPLCAGISKQDSLPGADSSVIGKDFAKTLSPLVLKYAEKFQVAPETIDQPEAWCFVEEWLGIRYVWGGNSKKGIDCSAFTERFLNEVYGVKSSRLVMGQYEKCKIIDSSDLRLGDLIFFKTHNKRKGLTHVAFSLGGRYFIHASSSRGVVIDNLDKNYYRKTYRHSGRILPDKKAPSFSLPEASR